jgi:hypothetical protein
MREERMAGIGRRTAAVALVAAAHFAAPAHAQTQSRSESLAQDLSSCAGAVAAHGNLDVLTYPQNASGDLAPLLGAILQRLNVEPGVEGMTGRYAAADARRFWAEQPRRRREAAVSRCRTRFGGAE